MSLALAGPTELDDCEVHHGGCVPVPGLASPERVPRRSRHHTCAAATMPTSSRATTAEYVVFILALAVVVFDLRPHFPAWATLGLKRGGQAP